MRVWKAAAFGLALVMAASGWIGTKAQGNTSVGEAPANLFDGKDLSGWQAAGPAWSVEGGAIMPGAAGTPGWLALKEGYEDFVLEFSFQCPADCHSGVLLRASKEGDHLNGIYIPLGGNDMGKMYRASVSADQKVSNMTAMPAPSPGAIGIRALDEGPCDPEPCAGIRDAKGGALNAGTIGGASKPDYNLQPNGWNQAVVTMRGDVISASINGTPVASARMDVGPLYGELALESGNAKFKDIHIWDLTRRSAGVEKPFTAPDFRKVVLSDDFYSEGISAGDINRDGKMDVVAGPFWFEGPDFKVAHEIYPPETVNIAGPQGGYPDEYLPTVPGQGIEPEGGREHAQSTAMVHGSYSTNFQSFVYDFNGDGWPDVLVIMGFGPRPTFSAHLFINPKGERRLWDNYLVSPVIADEIENFADIDGNGKPAIIMRTATNSNWTDGQVGILRPNWSDVTKKWTFTPVSEKGSWFGHGSGVGDVNGDGRMDILNSEGWWEHPADNSKGLWKYHKQRFGVDAVRCGPGCGGSVIAVYDVNGDGLNDVVTSMSAHGPGLGWFEQVRNGNEITWKRHTIMGDPSTPMKDRADWEETDKSVAFIELHADAYADMNGDGLQDIITGKRWWSHGYRYEESDANDPPVLYWFELKRNGKTVSWVPHLIDNSSGVGTQIQAVDVNGDGKPDVLTAQRKGIEVFLNNVSKH